MRSLVLLVGVGLLGCQNGPQVPDSPAPETPTVAAPQTVAPLTWDPSAPVDLSKLATHRVFVTDVSASVCPTQAEAKANGCGNSVESPNVGYTRSKGQTVTVVGEPENGFWKAIRFTKHGTLPSWVDASRVALTPDSRAFDTFQVGHSSAQRFRSDVLTLATEPGPSQDEYPLDPAIFLVAGDKKTALRLPPCFKTQHDQPYIRFHGCLLYADCGDTDYVCDDTYCDEILVDAKPGAPLTHKDITYNVLDVTALADRMGTFEADCE